MCTVSAIMDYGQYRIPLQQWTPDSWADFKEIIRRLDALDKKLDQPDCVDPAKQRWMQEVEERLRRLEGGAA
jgi:hypothetical protein